MLTQQLAERPAHMPAGHVVDFDVYDPPEVERDYHAAWGKLHEPWVPDMVWTPRNGGHWIVTRGAAMKQVWEDFERFSSHILMVPKAESEEHQMVPSVLDPPHYRPYRLLINNGLAPKQVRRREESIRKLSIALIEAVRADGRCNFTTAYAEQLPIAVFLDMCQLPFEDAPMLKKWADMHLVAAGAETREESRVSFANYLTRWLNERKGGDGEDVLSSIVNGTINGEPITMEDAVQMSTQVLMAGLDTVVNFLGFVMLFLARNPEHRQELVDNPSLIPAAVDELFRRFPIVNMCRMAVKDMHFAGVDLKAGDVILMPSSLHGLDERENPDPLKIDYDRPRIEHSTFGQGAHRCAGVMLAKVEVRITLEEWLSRIPQFKLADDADIRFRSGMVGRVLAVPLVWPTDG